MPNRHKAVNDVSLTAVRFSVPSMEVFDAQRIERSDDVCKKGLGALPLPLLYNGLGFWGLRIFVCVLAAHPESQSNVVFKAQRVHTPKYWHSAGHAA